VELLEVLYGRDDTEGDLDSMLLIPAPSTISKWRTFKLLKRVQLLNPLVDLDVILYCGMALKVISIIPKLLSVCPPL
jgi:hypothetical protein